MKDRVAILIDNNKVAEGLRRLVLSIDGGFPTPLPGQFVNLRLGESLDPLLRRPFSVYSFDDGDPALVGVLYAPVGRWTRRLASREVGTEINVLGPLGSGFVAGSEEVSVLVAGGRGVAPLIYLAKTLESRGRRFVSLVGARGSGDLYVEGALGRGGLETVTEDGSAGAKGVVTDLLERQLAGWGGRAAVYSCGPIKMLRKVSEICAAHEVSCQTSVETVFACGMGVCRGCIVHTPDPNAPYLMACSDGPVLRAEEVDWESFAP